VKFMRALHLTILFLLIPLCAHGQSVPRNRTGADLEPLRALLRDGTAAKIQVLHFSDSALTRVSLTPQRLRAWAETVKTFDKNLVKTFDPVFSGIAVKHENHDWDVRWGVLFYDSRNHEIATLFVNRFGYGYLNGENVSFDVGFHGVDIATRLHKATGIPRG